MRLADVVSYGFANLKRHRMRTALTVCGVGLGIATLTVLVSLGSGLRLFFTSQFDKEELTTKLRVLPQGTKDATRSLLQGGGEGQTGAPLTDANVTTLSGLGGVKVAYPEVMTFVGAFANRRIMPLVTEGLPVAAMGDTHKRSLLAGQYWSEDDAPPGCVLPSNLLRELGFTDPQQALGLELELSSYIQLQDYKSVTEEVENPRKGGPPIKVRRFERHPDTEWTPLKVPVLGVYDSKAFGIEGRMVHVPFKLGIKLAKTLDFRQRHKDNAYKSVVVKVTSHSDLAAVDAAVKDLGFETQSVFDVLRQIKVFFIAFQILLALFGGIGVAVAFFGIANTMVMAVLERTREIGVMKALGARDRDVRRLFVAEAAGIGLLGGAVGLAGGWVIGQMVNGISRMVWQPLRDLDMALFVIEPWLVAGCLALSMGVATIAGLIPAIRAARMNPVEALRRD